MNEKVSVPAFILARNKELLREYEVQDESDEDHNKTTTTVFEYEEQMRLAVKDMLNYVNPKVNSDNDNDTDDEDDNSDAGSDTNVVDSRDFRLDFERDTIEEVTNVVTLYPEAFDDEDGDPPQVTNNISLRSVPFIPSILSLWVKYCNHRLVRDDEYGLIYFNVMNPKALLPRFVCHLNTIIRRICELRFNNPVNDNNRFFDEQCANVLQWFVDNGILANFAGNNYIHMLIENNSSDRVFIFF